MESYGDFKESMIIAETWKIRALRKDTKYRHFDKTAGPF